MRRLVCVECSCESAGAGRGWQAHLFESEDGAEDVACFCPECAAQEFGSGGSTGSERKVLKRSKENEDL